MREKEREGKKGKKGKKKGNAKERETKKKE
jgi:hypothetical protein